ncbi:MAG: class I tRNA ligase family protein, partial [Gammaproteobacteria bacterium]|nr:class I tRNA ligase family protein [Gammaproteobacteria bacterium]
EVEELSQIWKGSEIENIDWNNLHPEQLASRREIHEILRIALIDFKKYQFNTVVAGCMKIMNVLSKVSGAVDVTSQPHAYEPSLDAMTAIKKEGLSILLRLLSPIAPHISQKLWSDMGYGDDILKATWPVVDEAALVKDSIELVVQVNGKVRGKINVATGAAKELIEQAAQDDPNVQKFTEGKTVRKIIVVPGRLVNIVAN